jgi:hypothetical protein
MQNKLVSAATTVLLQFKFAHLKVVLEQVLFTTKCDMNEMAKMIE